MSVQNNYTGDFSVRESFEAGNMAWGFVVVPVTADTVSTVTVSGLSLSGSGEMLTFVTGTTSSPGDPLEQVSTSSKTDGSSFEINVYRTVSTDTGVSWFAFRKAS